MMSALFFAFAAAHAAIFWFGAASYRRTRAAAMAMALVPLPFLAYDCLVLGLGRSLGPGEALRMLSLPRYWAHWMITPAWVIAAGSIASRGGLLARRPRPLMGAFCALAVALIALDVPKLFALRLYPSCAHGLVHYAEAVEASARCSPDVPVMPRGGPPVGAIVTATVILAVGVGLLLRERDKRLLFGALFMFALAGLPQGRFGLWPGNLGEIGLALAMIMTAERLTRSAASPA
jgi:hypothetical protein